MKRVKYALCSVAVSVIFQEVTVFLMEKCIPEIRVFQENTWEWLYPPEEIAPEFDRIENYHLENLKSPAAVYQSQIGEAVRQGTG